MEAWESTVSAGPPIAARWARFSLAHHHHHSQSGDSHRKDPQAPLYIPENGPDVLALCSPNCRLQASLPCAHNTAAP